MIWYSSHPAGVSALPHARNQVLVGCCRHAEVLANAPASAASVESSFLRGWCRFVLQTRRYVAHHVSGNQRCFQLLA